MSLAVEVAGFGLSPSLPTGIFIICVQQESFQAWTVYRFYSNFHELSEQLQVLHPGTEKLPTITGDLSDIESLEQARVLINNWLQSVVMNHRILRTQSMYQFLCADANVAPSHLELHWRTSDGSFDEMEMDDMFDKEHEDMGDMSFEDNFENHDHYEDEDYSLNNSAHGKLSSSLHSKNGKQCMHRTNDVEMEEFDRDGLDIQSLSTMEAEFMYDKDDEQVEQEPVKRKINLDAFNIIKVIGKGSFGKVFLVRYKARGTLHAMKVLKKDHIIKKNQVEHTKTERSVLGYIRHPFIVGLTMAFQTADKLFFVLDYCAGGELFFHLGKMGRFPEERAKYYAAQITLALEYVHKLNIIYRYLKFPVFYFLH